MHVRLHASLRLLLSLSLVACAAPMVGCDDGTEPPPPEFVDQPTKAAFAPGGDDFWRLPLPSDLRREDDGTTDFDRWPGDWDADLLVMWLRASNTRLTDGWGLSSGAFVQTDGAIDSSTLPSAAADTLGADAAVYMVNIDANSPHRGERIPLDVIVAPEDPYTPANLIAARPVFGFTRRASTQYAFVVTNAVKDESGSPLGSSETFFNALHGLDGADTDLVAHLAPLATWLDDEGLDKSAVATAGVFTTIDPNQTLLHLAEWAEMQPAPTLSSPWVVAEEYESYQVLTAEFDVPQIQSGNRPYSRAGEGLIIYGDDGWPVIQETQSVRLALTVPKQAQPEGGFPLTIYMHGSGGEYYQAINRGPIEENAPRDEQDPPVPGTGPAEWLARRGVASVGFDFPLHGNRNDPPDTEGLMLYNLLGNIEATIDNFNVSAMELVLLSRLMTTVSVDASLAATLDAGAAADGLITFNPDRLTAMGQSMGTTLGVAWTTVDPRVKGLVYSGAGGILVDIAVNASEPFALRPLLEELLGLEDGQELHLHHPMLHALQSVWDLVDPINKARHVTAEPFDGFEPRHVLMTAGVIDGYFSPISEAAMAVGLGVDHVGDEVEPVLPDALRLAGRQTLSYPVQNNVNDRTHVVIQYEAPHTLGHYVVFNQDGARHQYTCFVASVGTEDGAKVSAPAGLDDPCP